MGFCCQYFNRLLYNCKSVQTEGKIEFSAHVTHRFDYWMVYVYKANIATIQPTNHCILRHILILVTFASNRERD